MVLILLNTGGVLPSHQRRQNIVHKGEPTLSNIHSIAQNLLQKDYHGEGGRQGGPIG